jgi:hypothetical protein
LDSPLTRNEPEMSLRRRRVGHRPSLNHRDLGWRNGNQPSPLASSRRRHGVHASRSPHNTTKAMPPGAKSTAT